jgi:murein L,D-transpeptidase YcbB/YkuD
MTAEWRLLKSGDKGVNVKALQRLLLNRGAEVDVDGTFGTETEAAVKAFQSTNNLNTDGVVGGATWPAVVVQVANGARGEPVKAVQELLVKSASGLSADGTFGPETEKATRTFQQKVGLDVDGIVGPFTWQVLITENATS